MIKELTQSQRNKFVGYVEKWTEIGLSTNRLNFDECKKSSAYLYKNILKRNNVPIMIFKSPLSAWYAAYMFQYCNNQVRAQLRAQAWDQVEDQVEDQVRAQVRAQVAGQVEDQVRAQVAGQVAGQVEDQVRAQVADQLRAQVRAQVVGQVEDQVRDQVVDFVYPYIDGNFYASYFSFYDFFNKELNIKYNCHWEWYKNTTKHNLVYPLNNVCIFSEKPISIKIKNKRLHCENGASIEYEDGFSVWALNGVRVSKEIIMTPADKLDPNLIFKEKSADVRREVVNKIGITKLYEKLNATECGKMKLGNNSELWYDEYTLLKLDFEGKKIPALKMLNASEGIYHVEGVHPSCQTVQEAFFWRYPSLKGIDFELIGIS